MLCICPVCGDYVYITTDGAICHKCGWTSKLKQYANESTAVDSSPCKYCGNNPANGGSGICFCTLGLPEIRF